MLALLRVLRLRSVVIATPFCKRCGGYVSTLNCVMYRFIIRFIVEP